MMSWKENWERNKEDENRKRTVFAWRNKNNHILLEIIDNHEISDHEVTKERAMNDYTLMLEDTEILAHDTNKQELRSEAVSWMENHSYQDIKLEGRDLKEKLLEVGKKVEPRSQGVSNSLSEDELETLLGTLQAFQVDRGVLVQSKRDLTNMQYRIFDWLGMMIDTDMSEKDKWIFEEMGRIYIQEKSIDGLIRRLRRDDLLVKYNGDK